MRRILAIVFSICTCACVLASCSEDDSSSSKSEAETTVTTVASNVTTSDTTSNSVTDIPGVISSSTETLPVTETQAETTAPDTTQSQAPKQTEPQQTNQSGNQKGKKLISNSVTISYSGFDGSGSMTNDFNFTVENKNSSDLSIMVYEFIVNGKKVDAFETLAISSGETKTLSASVFADDLEGIDLNNITSIKASFICTTPIDVKPVQNFTTEVFEFIS